MNGVQRGVEWFRARSRAVQIALGVAALLVVCGMCSTLTSMAQGDNTSTATVSTRTATTAAHKAPAQPTATPKPRATATPLSPQAQLERTVKDASLLGKLKGVEWDAADGFAIVKIEAADNLTNGLIRDGIKMDAYNVQRAIWTSGPKPKGEVQVQFYGPTTDAYGNTSDSLIANARLTKDTAGLFNWGGLTWRTAWDAYDGNYMLPDLANG